MTAMMRRIAAEWRSVCRSQERPELGREITLTLNQRDEVVMKSTVKFLAPLRSIGVPVK